MKVLYFIFNGEPRSTIIRKGLMRNNVDVDETFMRLRSFRTLLSGFKKYYDVIFVREYGHHLVPYAKFLKNISKSSILLFDPYISLYDTSVHDRKLVEATSWKARCYFLLDKYTCKIADMCLLDTNEHIKYFNKTFGLNSLKFRRIFVGADDDIFYPRQVKRKDDYFNILWYGTYIPLHGTEYIIRTAKILEKYKDIKFKMVGRGQTYKQMKKIAESLRVSNIEFVNRIEYTNLPMHISKANVCLGIFGNTGKARRVIPNKVFQTLAVKKPVITGNTAAAREALSHMENAYLCDIASPKSIAKAILILKEDKSLRRNLAEKGYQLFKKRFTIDQIGKNVKTVLEEALS